MALLEWIISIPFWNIVLDMYFSYYVNNKHFTFVCLWIKCHHMLYYGMAPGVWHCNSNDMNKVGKLQYRALKFVCNDFNIS